MVFLAIIGSVGAAILAQYCNKKLAGTEPVERLLAGLFFGCAVLGWVVALFFPPFDFNFYVAALGFAGFWAMWSFTNGIKIGLAQTILVLPATTIVAVLLSAIFLQEWRFFDPRSFGGFLLLIGGISTVGATVFFATSRQHGLIVRQQWITLAVIYTLINGLVSFLIKYFAVQQVGTVSFLTSWYSGAFASALLLYLFKGRGLMRITAGGFFLYILFIISTFSAMAGSFIALILAPAALVLPLYGFLFVVGVVVIAVWVFGEGKKFGRREKAGLALGLIGGILLSVRSYWQY